MTKLWREIRSATRVAVLTAVLVTMLAACQPRGAPQPPPTPAGTVDSPTASLIAAMSAEQIAAHLAALQRIADEHDGNRAVGTPGYRASVDYVGEVLTEDGFQVTTQDFPYTAERITAQTAAVIDGQPVDLQPIIMGGSPSTPGNGVTAPLSLPAAPLGCTAADYRNAADTIVLVERGSCAFADKSRLAHRAGALAVLIYDIDPDAPELRGTLVNGLQPPTELAPTAGIPRTQGLALRDALSAAPVQIHLDLRMERATGTSQNVIVEWPDTPADAPVVMIGAHLDSVPAGPGINDNGSGVALLLALASVLAERGEASGLRLGFWGAEEIGLIGSRHYVEQLPDPHRIIGYLNFDMVASGNGIIGAYGDDPLLPALRDAFTAAGVGLAETDLAGASDHASFTDAGIPVAGIFTGAGGEKTAGEADRYGGAVGEPYDRCYHRDCDTVATVTTPEVIARLELIGDSVAVAVRNLLRSLR